MSEDLRRQIVVLLPRLRGFAYSLVGSMDDADDIVQAACERALARLDQFQPGTRLDHWMFRIVKTVTIDRFRRSKARSAVALDEGGSEVAFDARVHEQTAARLALEAVQREIARLPVEQRELLFLVAIDGMSYQDAAVTLGIPIGTVMSRLSRARHRLASAVGSPTDVREARH
jgi:RNA polymerase sigma-70 factor (ECF subfamily)